MKIHIMRFVLTVVKLIAFSVGIFNPKEPRSIRKETIYLFLRNLKLEIIVILKNLVLLIKFFKVQKDAPKSFDNEKVFQFCIINHNVELLSNGTTRKRE